MDSASVQSIAYVPLDRRRLLTGCASLAAAGLLSRRAKASAGPRQYRLVAAPGRWRIVPPPDPDTPVWSYGGKLPGPELRVRQGESIRIAVENRLPEETTVHCHGIRLPIAMDGVPHVTQKPVAPGETFVYEFICPDAGTFWYHPHQHSSVQVGRGLYGALIVEEREPVAVDRDLTWVLSDWRLLQDGSISDDFGNMHDMAHNGRIGNTVTVNGSVRETFSVRAGERIRLRLINAANARIFGLKFDGHEPRVIALDGQPVEPYVPENGQIVLGPAMRADIVIDMTGAPGARHRVVDTFYRTLEYRLLDLAYTNETPLKAAPREPFRQLPANPLAEPDLANAERFEVKLGGGMMGMMMSAIVDGKPTDMRTMMQNGLAWAINGAAATEHVHEPMLTLRRGRSYALDLINETAWHHPMHLHGHSFRVIARNGQPVSRRPWQDTVLVNPRERVEIALVADNPGDWMFHCHILEHQASGMMSLIRVSA